MRLRIPGDTDLRKPFSLKGQDTIQGAGLPRRGWDVPPYAKFSPLLSASACTCA